MILLLGGLLLPESPNSLIERCAAGSPCWRSLALAPACWRLPLHAARMHRLPFNAATPHSCPPSHPPCCPDLQRPPRARAPGAGAPARLHQRARRWVLLPIGGRSGGQRLQAGQCCLCHACGRLALYSLPALPSIPCRVERHRGGSSPSQRCAFSFFFWALLLNSPKLSPPSPAEFNDIVEASHTAGSIRLRDVREEGALLPRAAAPAAPDCAPPAAPGCASPAAHSPTCMDAGCTPAAAADWHCLPAPLSPSRASLPHRSRGARCSPARTRPCW